MEKLLLPTPQMVEWADCEMGVIIHYDLSTYVNDYDYFNFDDDPLPPSIFNPDRLDTDQWVKAAKDLGAGYAVLVAKHCTGFCLWPTDVHEYSIKNSPYKGGKGDIVGEFFASCKKYGIRPGLYYSAAFNQYMKVENPGLVRDRDQVKQKAYNDMVLRQLTELWTRYGKVFEIWFDGGCIPPEQGGPDIASLLNRLQPDAVVYQGPRSCKSLVRWVGNERGIASENCSSIFNFKHMSFDGTEEMLDEGDTFGNTWCPAESDLSNRKAKESSYGGWFWGENQESAVVSAQELFDTYLKSVGRNTNMLVGMAIDRHGRFAETDTRAFEEFGAMRRAAFGTPVAECDVQAGDQSSLTLRIPEDKAARYLVLGERIEAGERVYGYRVSGCDGAGQQIFDYQGKVIGHKRILPLPQGVRRAKLEILKCRATPRIRWFKAY